jgi:hypothetical protein
MSPGRIVGWASAATVALVVALVLAGSERGLALLVYVLVLAALALVVLVAALRDALPPAEPWERLLAHAPRREGVVEQYETIDRLFAPAGSSAHDLHFRLRPLVREVVAARLARRDGVDLDQRPEVAHALVGEGRVWELARPDRPVPKDHFGGGWSRRELEQLVDELEGI